MPGVRLIWKTTSYILTEKNYPTLDKRGGKNYFEVDSSMCAIAGVGCLNISWTKHLPKEVYWDNVHFHSQIYSWMNRQLLHDLTQESLDLYELFKANVTGLV